MRSLSDYSLIGNCRSAALVSRYGSIDWCCLPEFHSPAIFTALLDREGGHFSIAPTGPYQSSQQYLENTNVVETIFTTGTGQAVLTDAFVALTEEEKAGRLFPDHEILRLITCAGGTLSFQMEFAPSVFYSRFPADLVQNGKLGIKFSSKENSYILLSTLAVNQVELSRGKAVAAFELSDGESVFFSLSTSSQEPAILPELLTTGQARLIRTIAYWKSWIGQCVYKGLYREWVVRSALTLRLLVHAPSGAIIAAPTAALPEEIGGERNWDYRYCWLRDASFTARALIKLGFHEEAHAYMNWILHATRLTRPKLQVVYSVFGHARLKETILDWLEGFEGAKPVRIGNGAYNQHQLDVYGEVLDAFYAYSRLINEFDNSTRKFLLGLGDVICRMWNQPDKGIWEVRSGSRQHTHSKVMAWVGLDRLLKLSKTYGWRNVKLEKFQQAKAAIAQQVEQRGYNYHLGAYTRELDGHSLDASTLVFPLVGYCHASSPKMTSTRKAICKQLAENNLVYRYRSTDDGLRGGEGSFGICNFWLAENLAKTGNVAEAVKVFDAILSHASPTGLLAEEVDPSSGMMLGNYPQGFTHIGLINAALSIHEAIEKGEGLA